MLTTVTKLLARCGSLLALSALCSVAFGEPPIQVAGQPCPKSAVRVFVTATGGVVLNGRSIEANCFGAELTLVKPQPIMVCYSRESFHGKPPPTVPSVLDATMALKVPIRFYTDSTFVTPASLKMNVAL